MSLLIGLALILIGFILGWSAHATLICMYYRDEFPDCEEPLYKTQAPDAQPRRRHDDEK